MWWQYLLVFIGALLFDVVPFPFPPAFTIMVFLQIMFGLNIWLVIGFGVAFWFFFKKKVSWWGGPVAWPVLPTTPLFLAGGMAKIKPLYIIPAFFIGKFTSDAIAVHLGKYASEHAKSIIEGALSWKSITSLVVGLLLICALLFIDWRSLIQKKKFQLKFKIWK